MTKAHHSLSVELIRGHQCKPPAVMLSRSLCTSIEIDSSPETVWRLLMGWAAFPDWNPFIKSLEGEAKEGAYVRVFVQPPGGKGMEFRPRLLKGASPLLTYTAMTCYTAVQGSWTTASTLASF